MPWGSWGGTLPGGGGVPWWGGTLPGPAGGVPCWGYPGWGGTLGGTLPGPARGVPCWGYPGGGVPCQVQPGGYPAGGTLVGGYPARSSWGVPCQVQLGGVTLPSPAGGVPWLGVGVPCRGGYPGWGSTQLGQHREYLLHGGRSAGGYPGGGGYPVRTTGSTCYTAGGMPLTFTQEDFLVT